jgi:hypothetical protein
VQLQAAFVERPYEKENTFLPYYSHFRKHEENCKNDKIPLKAKKKKILKN